MLVLSRKVGELFLIGDDVVLTVLRIGLNNVRIGIEAPREINIARSELLNGDQPACDGPVNLSGLPM